MAAAEKISPVLAEIGDNDSDIFYECHKIIWNAFYGEKTFLSYCFSNSKVFTIPSQEKVTKKNLTLMFNNQVVACATMGIDGYIENFAVRNDMKNKGFGRMMLNLLEETAISQGNKYTSLFCEPNNLAFYKKCGYVKCRYQETDNCCIDMYKELRAPC